METKSAALSRRHLHLAAMLCALAGIAASPTSSGAEREEQIRRPHEPEPSRGRPEEQQYRERGARLAELPRDASRVRHGGADYWYHRGDWYRRRGGDFFVVAAPIGAFVPLLPSFYTTAWWGGIPYYYANHNYYLWDASVGQYRVVLPPAGLRTGG